MPVSLEALNESCEPLFAELFANCEENGTPMRPYFVVRRPRKQAELWRQSRSALEVRTGIKWLREAGALWLADVIVTVGPQWGRWATNAAPGNSWHQWAEAVDAYAEVDGRMSWDTIPGQVGGPGDAFYRFYAERAIELGLRPLGPTLGDWVHVQRPRASSPARVLPWPDIDAEMRRRFGS